MNFIFLAVIALCILMTIKNVFTIVRIKKEKNYVDAYTAMLKDDPYAYTNLLKYLEKEKEKDLITKTNVVKVYLEAKQNIDTFETIKGIDLKTVIFNSKGKLHKIERYSDIFIWLIYDLVIFHSQGKYNEMDKLNNVVKENESALSNKVEYLVYSGVYNALKQDYQIDAFLKDLINGDYNGVVYDKKLIGLYKRISAMILVYKNEKIDDMSKDDLTTFSQTLVGKNLMKDLGILDSFKPKEEDNKELEDKKEEDNK